MTISTPKTPYHHRAGGGFRNPPGSPQRRATIRDFLRFLLWDMRRAKLPPIPAGLTSVNKLDLTALEENQIAWLGHACFALKLGGKLILTDPYLSPHAGPLGMGPKRFLAPALSATELPQVDLIVISHNHYDHVDTVALKAYRWREGTPVVCPLGLAQLLRKLGFSQVTELDWWQQLQIDDLTITALPAVHFSGRGLFDRDRTLWSSMSLASPAKKLWFGGDTGYGEVFREIGERAGPFDLALVGIGAYEPRIIMEASHATPEEGVKIARDIGAKAAVGMHWGSIMLTPEDPFEAPERFRRAARDQQYGEANAWIMQVGETRAF